ncbi:TPA: hypothetical protein N0F65_011877 [Lagenidium giganteum]|uniref:SWIM-type domain-containing protein n=1 Tax=Lagenidium giganteum TaxID=4803 RepID=A0AAV2YIH3_9STRA|nr:TPA: hypothetical protein N0F65_011877 [Lagenidium giganteum]
MSLALRKEKRYGTLADAVAVIETFAEQTQRRHVRIQQPLAQAAPSPSTTAVVAAAAAAAVGTTHNMEGTGAIVLDSNATSDAIAAMAHTMAAASAATTATTTNAAATVPTAAAATSGTFEAEDSQAQNIVVLECENAPECKWFVRLSYVKTEKKWKISSMNLVHHRAHCLEAKADPASSAAFHRLVPEGAASMAASAMLPISTMSAAMAAASTATATPTLSLHSAALMMAQHGGVSPVVPTSTSSTPMGATAAVATAGAPSANGSHVYVGQLFPSWKDAIAAVRTLAHQMGRRAVAGKPTPMEHQGKTISVRKVVCQNRRNSNCEWFVALEESQSVVDQFTVISMALLHSKECLETCNFSARRKETSQATTPKPSVSPTPVVMESTGAMDQLATDALGSAHNAVAGLSMQPPPSASLLVDDLAKYQLTHEMRWSTGKEATKAISDFTLVVQRKRSKLCKRNNGGSNKKYVCSDESCLWFVQLVKGWKSKNWKISAMNLKHSDNCKGEAKPTARQLAEMRFFRQAVITHSKSSGKLLTDNFLTNTESGIKIPRGMAYRAQRLVVASSTDDLTESYKFIPSLLDSFAKKNPGSMISYDKDDQGHFVRAFLMPNAASLALLCMQQVFGIKVINYDNVSYNGCLTLLIGRDGNMKSQVIAFALMPSSDMEHMRWFLSMAKGGGARFDGTPVFCSPSQNGLLRAFANEARNAKIMFCVRSLLEEMSRDKNIPSLGGLEELIWDMQRQDTEEGFMKILNQLESLNAAAAAFIRAVHPKNWACYLNRSIRLYKWSSTSAEEALQGSDIQVSDEAPFDMMYSFLAFLMDFIFKKSQLANKLLAENPLLTPGADSLYRQELQESELFTVRLCDEQVAFTWRTGARPKITHRVDLALRTCTCGQMYQLGLPCRHFIAVSMHFGNEASLMDGFDAIYKAVTYAEVNRNLRIEIPAAEDLSKDPTIFPAQSTKGNKYKKRPRSATDLESKSSSATPGASAPTSKAPRLEFDSDVVSGLTELV